MSILHLQMFVYNPTVLSCMSHIIYRLLPSEWDSCVHGRQSMSAGRLPLPTLCRLGESSRTPRQCTRPTRHHTNRSVDIPHFFFLGRCFWQVASTQPGFTSLARQFLIPQVHIHTVHPPLLQSSFPSPPLHIHHHHSSPHIFFIPSHEIRPLTFFPALS